jgi:hypothetical protein
VAQNPKLPKSPKLVQTEPHGLRHPNLPVGPRRKKLEFKSIYLRVASLANQHLSGNEKVPYYMHKHHHFDDVVTQQQPACFVRVIQIIVPRPSTCFRFGVITACPDARSESLVSSTDPLILILDELFL